VQAVFDTQRRAEEVPVHEYLALALQAAGPFWRDSDPFGSAAVRQR
jgi:hypothetical protein